MNDDNRIDDLEVTNADDVRGAGAVAPPDISKQGLVDTARGARDKATAAAAAAEDKLGNVGNAIGIDITPDRP